MIVKDIDPKNTNDKLVKAGYLAERQMAFYLKRAFSDKNDIYVLNDIRLEQDGDIAQIDHLIIHTYGFIIIESKSVSSKVIVNEHAEWKRIFNTKETGMPSPIQQAKRQSTFLKSFLQANTMHAFRESIINKLISKPQFTNYKFDVLVAISDTGIIERKNIELPEVFKADAIDEQIIKIISQRKKDLLKALVNPFSSDGYSFHKDTIKKIAIILSSLHKPANISTLSESYVQEEKIPYQKNITNISPDTKQAFICSKCKSHNLEIRFGRNYYFKCLDCDANMPIKHTCNTPNCKPKTKKRKLQFFKVCEHCHTEELFYEKKA